MRIAAPVNTVVRARIDRAARDRARTMAGAIVRPDASASDPTPPTPPQASRGKSGSTGSMYGYRANPLVSVVDVLMLLRTYCLDGSETGR